jgi:hypothetical protein
LHGQTQGFPNSAEIQLHRKIAECPGFFRLAAKTICPENKDFPKAASAFMLRSLEKKRSKKRLSFSRQSAQKQILLYRPDRRGLCF